MLGINKAILIGHIGNDPSERKTKNGETVTNFTVATTEYYSSTSRIVEWHNVVAFGRVGDYVLRNVHKGDAVYVEGCMRTQKWTDRKSGEKMKSFKIHANRITKLYARKDDNLIGEPEQLNLDEGILYDDLQEKEDDFPF